MAALAQAICALIDGGAVRRRLGDGAIAKAAMYGIDAVGARWEALIARVTQG